MKKEDTLKAYRVFGMSILRFMLILGLTGIALTLVFIYIGWF